MHMNLYFYLNVFLKDNRMPNLNLLSMPCVYKWDKLRVVFPSNKYGITKCILKVDYNKLNLDLVNPGTTIKIF